jgi:hypothetical protein
VAEGHLSPVWVAVDVDVGHAHGGRMSSMHSAGVSNLESRDVVDSGWEWWLRASVMSTQDVSVAAVGDKQESNVGVYAVDERHGEGMWSAGVLMSRE